MDVDAGGGGGAVARSLASALEDELMEYHRLLARLEERLPPPQELEGGARNVAASPAAVLASTGLIGATASSSPAVEMRRPISRPQGRRRC